MVSTIPLRIIIIHDCKLGTLQNEYELETLTNGDDPYSSSHI